MLLPGADFGMSYTNIYGTNIASGNQKRDQKFKNCKGSLKIANRSEGVASRNHWV